MGQQQLLLIVLGVIIVGIAIVVGINLFNAQAEESAKDALISTGTNLGSMAQQYYKKPEAMGGGNSAFDGFGDLIEPTLVKMRASDPNIQNGGNIVVESSANDVCTIRLTPNNDEYEWTILTTVGPTSIVSTPESN